MDKRLIILLFTFVVIIPLGVVAEKTLIYLEHSNTLTFDQDRIPDCQILRGDVQFRHDEAMMYCDSAYFFNKSNVLHAYSNVRMVQGDSIFVYGDRLFYDGNTKLARLRNNVRLENGSATLFTDSLNYDRIVNVGYYFDHGTIVDSLNTLKSVNGKYYPKTEVAVFQKNVILTNPDFVLKSDTLIYNTRSKIANIVGPSRIDYEDAWAYSEYGWYDTQKDDAQLLDNSFIKDYDSHTVVADTLFYDHDMGYAEGKTNVVLLDSASNIMIKGGYGFYNQNTKYAYVVKRATSVSFNPDDSDSTFVTADTLFYNDVDSVTTLKGYYNVQAWSKDFQGIADSVFYSAKDSITRLFGTPVAWQDKNQATGDSILIYSKNGGVEKVEIIGAAFMFMRNDSTEFNQLSGKKVTCYVDSGRLKKVFVDGNALSVYFAEEDKDPSEPPSDTLEYVGINVSESSELTMYISKDNKPERIILTPASSGVMYTPDKRTNTDITMLKGFLDCAVLRPKDKYDIYNFKDKQALREAADKKPKHKRKKR